MQTRDADDHGDEPAPLSAAELVERAAGGDELAWRMLVDRYAGLVWSVVRGFRLEPATASDVAQTVWLRLVQSLEDLRDPSRLAGWLATTARRECIRTTRTGGRELPTDEVREDVVRTPPADSPEVHLLADEQQRELWRAVRQLSPRCQLLLRTIAYEPDHSYAEISKALDMPVGSIGPTRSRCLVQLRGLLQPDEAPGDDK